MKVKTFFAIIAVLLWDCLSGLHAQSGYRSFKQPNGVQFTARESGYCCTLLWYETPEGYMVVQGPDKYYHYANVDEAAEIVSTGLRVGIDDPVNVPAHPMQTPAIREKILAKVEAYNVAAEKNRQRQILRIQQQLTLTVGVLFVEFNDLPHYTGGTRPNGYTVADFENMLFSDNQYNTLSPDNEQVFGSLRDYYQYQSHGLLQVEGRIINTISNNVPDWLNMGNTSNYPGGGYWAIHDLLRDAINTAIGMGWNVDCDITCLIIAGDPFGPNQFEYGYAYHQSGYFGYSPADFDNNGDGQPDFDYANWFGGYAVHEREDAEYDDPLRSTFAHIGLHCHEMFHTMGWGLNGIWHGNMAGDWSSMSVGYRTGALRKTECPGDMDAVRKISMDWAVPTEVTSHLINEPIEYIEEDEDHNETMDFYQFTDGSGQQFVVENRQYSGFNSYLPAWWEPGENGGLLFWHYVGYISQYNDRNSVMLRRADNDNDVILQGLPHVSDGDLGDPFPGDSDNRNITMATTPNTNIGNNPTGFAVTNISSTGNLMRADFYHNYWSGSINQNTTWTGEIFVGGDITVESGISLTIDPNTTITFAANEDDQTSGYNTSKCELIVHGLLEADGVTFTSSNSIPGDWYGIVFDHANNNSYIQNSTIENAQYGVHFDNTDATLEGNVIQYNSGNGIRSHEASPTIYHSTIQNNGIGIYCEYDSHPYINDNYVINNNSYGIFCTQSCVPNVRHNRISNNSFGGIACLNSSSPLLIGINDSEPYGANEVISNTGSGVLAFTNSNPNLGTSISFPLAGYNDIYGNTLRQVYNYTSNTIFARRNWWGTPNPGPELFYGPVLYSFPLSEPSPYAGPTWGSLAKMSLPLAQNDTSDAEKYLEKAQLLEGIGKLEEAIAAYRYVVDNFGDSQYGSFALSRLMACRVKQGDITLEKNYMVSIIQKHAQNEMVTTALLWQPLVEVRSGNGQLALDMCDSLTNTYSGTDLARDAFFEKGTIQLYELNYVEVAKNTFEEFTQKYPKDPLLEHIGIILDNYITPNLSIPKPQTQKMVYFHIPENYALSQNYPNPFNPETEIHYQLPEDCRIVLTIYNLLGQKIRTLVDKTHLAGVYLVRWDGKDDRGVAVTSGVYLYVVNANRFYEVKKMLLLR